jgi:hypothetical protein
MYNQPAVFKGGYGDASHPTIDTSHLLTTTRGNQLYVNESGDAMKGDLDMKGNKIINIANPSTNSDVSSRSYVLSEVGKLKTELSSNLERLAAATGQMQVDIAEVVAKEVKALTILIQKQKEYVDHLVSEVDRTINQKVALAANTVVTKGRLPSVFNTFSMEDAKITMLGTPTHGLDAVNKSYVDKLLNRAVQYGFMLDIGHSLSGSMKVAAFKIPMSRTAYGLDRNRVNLQITPILYSDFYTDQIYMNITNFTIDPLDDSITVKVLAVRSSNEGWGLHLQAHLLVTIFETAMTLISAKT